MEKSQPFQRRKAWTNLAETASKRLENSSSSLISEHDLFRVIWSIYDEKSAKNLRGRRPSRQTYVRTRGMLRDEGIIRSDNDYPSFWRIMSVPDAPADTIVCQADRYCYISHMSAMQRYGLTNRRPEALFITSPPDAVVRKWNKTLLEDRFGKELNSDDIYIEPLFLTHHPTRVRRRAVDQLKTKFYGEWRKVRGEDQRIASIGQVFLDMLETPQRCGGMRHVLEVWGEHAPKYLKQIINAVEGADRPIWKVRAGYILDEHLNVANDHVLSWLQYAQRGGSRVLEPGRSYAEPFSSKWMISTNVG